MIIISKISGNNLKIWDSSHFCIKIFIINISPIHYFLFLFLYLWYNMINIVITKIHKMFILHYLTNFKKSVICTMWNFSVSICMYFELCVALSCILFLYLFFTFQVVVSELKVTPCKVRDFPFPCLIQWEGSFSGF